MSWGAELTKIRRSLRDPTGTIWSDAILRHIYNDIQKDFQHRTNVLEDFAAQRVPAVYQWSYQQDWEFRYLPATESQFYQCLNQHDDGVFCHRWETQQVAGIAADVADYGSHFTQAWEAYMDTPGEVVKMRFPSNFNAMKFIAYDEEPIFALTKKQVQSTDASYMTKEGMPVGYYAYDESDNSYVLYPRPSVSFVNELDGEGMALFADGDTEDTTAGTVAIRTGTSESSEIGAALDIIDATNSVFMVYDVSPTDVVGVADEPEFPGFLLKYIRFGVVSRAYGANTDGRIRSLADYWAVRYAMGINFAKRFKQNRRQDRDYRLITKGSVARRRYRHPRLPDGYPATWP